MDLSKFETASMSEEGVWFTPVDFDGNSLDCGFRLLGQDARTVRKSMSKRAAQAIARIQDKVESEGPDQAELLADYVADWRGVSWGEEEWGFSRENVVRLFRAVPFIADQVDRFVTRRKNFTRPASPSSEARCGQDSSSPSPKSETTPA